VFAKAHGKLHTRIYTQIGDNYGYSTVSFNQPLLFQVEHDSGERFNLAMEQPDKVKELQNAITLFNQQSATEGTFWENHHESVQRAKE